MRPRARSALTPYIPQTSTHFRDITRLRSVWHTALTTHVLAQDLPAPQLRDRPLSALSAAELERATRLALSFHANWQSASPVRRRERRAESAAAKVILLRFLPGREHRYLLSFGYSMQSFESFTIQIWDLFSDPLKCAGEWSGGMRVVGLAVNSSVGSPGTFAITVRSQ